MADVINMRRLGRACSSIVSKELPTRRDLKRLENFVKVLRGLLSKFQRLVDQQLDDGVVSNDELIEFGKKVSLFEAFLNQNRHILRHKEPLALPVSSSTEIPLGDSLLEKKSPLLGGSKKVAAEKSVVEEATKNEEVRRKQLFASSAGSRFADFMANDSNEGQKMLQRRLDNMRSEQENIKDDMSKILQNFKARIQNINDEVNKDIKDLDDVDKKATKTLNTLDGMTKRLNETMAQSSMNCKLCTSGVLLVLGLWIFAYLVMRIFPKVK